MLTPRWQEKKLKYHAKQCAAYRSTARKVAIAAGRGSGKTEIARRRVVRFLPVRKPWTNPRYFYALPTRPQAKLVAWQDLKDLTPTDWLAKEPDETNLIIRTKFGSELHCVGMDRPQRVEGVQWDGGILDESSDEKPGIYARTFRGALTHRQGWFWMIGVPKRHGIGFKDFKNFFDAEDTESYNWPSEDILTPEEIEKAKNDLDERDYDELFRASFLSAGGSIFYAFDLVQNTRSAEYNPTRPLLVCFDFNVDPLTAVIAQEYGERDERELYIFDEIFIRNANTPLALDNLFKRYGNHQSGIWFYGDATGRARKTSASASDYLIIKKDTRFVGARVYFNKSNPMRSDRFAACNALFCNAHKVRRCFVHPRCKHLVQDLLERNYAEGTSEPEDYGDIGHISDAMGYLIHYRFPIRIHLGGSLAVGITGLK